MEISEEEQKRREDKLEALKTNRFKQQELHAWRPTPSFGSTMIIFSVFGLIFLTLGISLYVVSDKVQLAEIKYSDNIKCSSNVGQGQYCDLEFETVAEIPGPVYVYYELSNFYQNHRRYVQSRSTPQLMGNDITVAQAEVCTPIIYNKDVATPLYSIETMPDGSLIELNPDSIAYPCGLIAKSNFTDNFTLSTTPFDDAHLDKDNVVFDESNIAWTSDISKFKNTNNLTQQWLNVTNQHFIVWMRTAGLPTFRKLYASIAQTLPAATYYLRIGNNYDMSGWKGSKKFVLSTSNSLGGQNYFLGVAFIVVGCLCVTLAMIFFAIFMSKKNSSAQQTMRKAQVARQESLE